MGMAPDPGGAYTVHCSFERAVVAAAHRTAIRDAVQRVHAATFLATELLNLYVRDRVENHGGEGMERLCEPNWLVKAYYQVTDGGGRGGAAALDPALDAVYTAHMAGAPLPKREGLTQTMKFECINLAAVASTNVWRHFQKRVLSRTRTCHALDAGACVRCLGPCGPHPTLRTTKNDREIRGCACANTWGVSSIRTAIVRVQPTSASCSSAR